MVPSNGGTFSGPGTRVSLHARISWSRPSSTLTHFQMPSPGVGEFNSIDRRLHLLEENVLGMRNDMRTLMDMMSDVR